MTNPVATCDACMKKEKLIYMGRGVWRKPDGWKDRPMHGKPQIVCGPACAEKMNEKAAG